MDDVGNFVDHSLTASLRVVGKEWHNILFGGCWRPKVVLKMLLIQRVLQFVERFKLRQAKFQRHWAFQDRRHEGWIHHLDHSIQVSVRFPLMALLSSSISFLISQRRSELGLLGVATCWRSLLLWLSPLLSQLVPERLSSCWSRSLISWFYLVSSSTLVGSASICRANAAKSWLDSIWTWEFEWNYAFKPNCESVVPIDDAKLMMRESSVM